MYIVYVKTGWKVVLQTEWLRGKTENLITVFSCTRFSFVFFESPWRFKISFWNFNWYSQSR